jgi:hypothetical protein
MEKARRKLYLSSAFQRLSELHFIRKFDISSDGMTIGNPGYIRIKRIQHFPQRAAVPE